MVFKPRENILMVKREILNIYSTFQNKRKRSKRLHTFKTFPNTRKYFQIGEYLGEHKELNLMVLTKFVELFEFEKMDIVTALRNFLGKFRLPGEAQKVKIFTFY